MYNRFTKETNVLRFWKFIKKNEKILAALPSSPIKNVGKSATGFMSYDRTFKQTKKYYDRVSFVKSSLICTLITHKLSASSVSRKKLFMNYLSNRKICSDQFEIGLLAC